MAIARLKPRVNEIAAIPCSGEHAERLGPHVPATSSTHRGGTTSEVLNTDAEGRLVLADALAYLAEKKPQLYRRHRDADGGVHGCAWPTDIAGAFGND